MAVSGHGQCSHKAQLGVRVRSLGELMVADPNIQCGVVIACLMLMGVHSGDTYYIVRPQGVQTKGVLRGDQDTSVRPISLQREALGKFGEPPASLPMEVDPAIT